ncbi:cupin domain-containing protein [Telmatospirillum sp.]|uniref:cupin domain-containing protein n=1 Tax=Telmatospirillum sp. TaxID=2079197 RepID=UPI00284C5CC5|nr:cupin domain-containing protein [Telmatospirillum sp.]MDR3437211.1 cupin domain-containing protein [Telmatospirillum sp.]
MQVGEKSNVVNVADVSEIAADDTENWISYYKPLTPALPRQGHLGVNLSRVPSGQSACPFHTHQLDDEVFYVISGRGVFRYGDDIREIGPGDCISCPAGSGIGHQIANPFKEDLLYLAIGTNDPNEVCTYPDSGKVMVCSLHKTGYLKTAEYFDGEPGPARIMAMAERLRRNPAAKK